MNYPPPILHWKGGNSFKEFGKNNLKSCHGDDVVVCIAEAGIDGDCCTPQNRCGEFQGDCDR